MKKETMENEKLKERAGRIRYSIINAITLFSTDAGVELIPIIDRLFLFFQDNVGIEIQESNSEKVVFSLSKSFPISEKLSKSFFSNCVQGELILSEDKTSKKYRIILYDANQISNPKLILEPDKANYQEKLNYLLRAINTEDSDKLREFLHQALIKAFDRQYNELDNKQIISINRKTISLNELNNTFSIACKESIREILDDVFESFKGNPIIFSKKWNMIKFFSVIRYPSDLRNNEKYTAQILLSSTQKRSFEANAEMYGDKFSSEKLEEPLFDNNTSLADICYKLDTVQFGLGYDSKNQRKEETKFYFSLNDDSDPQSVFYVPIHVNGCPWLALYRIIGTDEEKVDLWSLNYEMYSQYTLLIAEKIRLKTKEALFKLINYFLSEAIRINKGTDGSVNLREFIGYFNEAMLYLSCYFPFPALQFGLTTSEKSTTTFLESITDDDYSFTQSFIWQRRVKYMQEDFDDFKNKIKEIIRINVGFQRASKANRDLIAASYGLTHLYGSRLKLADKPRQEAMSLIGKTFKLTDEMKAKSKTSHEEFRKLEDLSFLFTIIAKQFTERVMGPFFEVCEDENYLEHGELNLKNLIIQIFENYISTANKTYSLPANEIKILPYIKDTRPFKVLYENILLEIIRNFEKAGAHHLKIEINPKDNILSFRNEIPKKSGEEYILEWQPITSKIFWGALYYLHLLLRETQTGQILFKYAKHQDESKIYYFCGIKFKGLNYE